MLFYVVVAKKFLVEYDVFSCVVVATIASFLGLVSYKSNIKSSSFSPPPPPTIDYESIVKLFNSCTTQHLRIITPPN
jgi:hypothetical protein